MAQEEEQLLKLREDEEKAKCAASGEAPDMNDTQFTKLDELLTQTQLFLLEKMEDITKKASRMKKRLLLWIVGRSIMLNDWRRTDCEEHLPICKSEALAMKKINV
ncbi:Uncharacterized protein Rs2_36225 [Raphanus sativus]|nr:Uncharacterized protein Rs2_36225 [Raphanus sativus]